MACTPRMRRLRVAPTPWVTFTLPVDGIKSKTLLEQVAEIQRQPTRQGLQAQDAQQLGDARVGLEELTGVDPDLDVPGHRQRIGLQGRAQPVDLPGKLPFAASQRLG